MSYHLAGAQDRRIQVIILTGFYGAVAPIGGDQQPQFSALLGLAEVLLAIRRLEPLLFRKHPDLVEMHWLGFRSVELAMRHAGARAHVLDVARLDHRAVAHAVAML